MFVSNIDFNYYYCLHSSLRVEKLYFGRPKPFKIPHMTNFLDNGCVIGVRQ